MKINIGTILDANPYVENSIFCCVHRLLADEEEISKKSFTAFIYAINIIQSRWPAGEASILKRGPYNMWYSERFKL